MCPDHQIAVRGSWGKVEWAVLSADVVPQAHQFYLKQSESDQAKLLTLFKLLANVGRITNREKFKQLGEKAGSRGKDLWEFKSFQLRFIGDFRPGYRFILAQGVRKKRDDLRPADIEAAVQVLYRWDQSQGGKR